MSVDIQRVREECLACRRNAPSQPAAPPMSLPSPDYPFQMVSSDYFHYAGKEYLLVVDRYSGWPVVGQAKAGTAEELVRLLRGYFATYGVPEEMATDGGAQYVSKVTQDFLRLWGVRHRLSSAYFPHSNLRAETGVKSIKRLITSNTGPGGSLDCDAFTRALLMYRNTPDRDTGVSPAQVLFARRLRDSVPVGPGGLVLRPDWVLTKDAREKALAKRHRLREEELGQHTKALVELSPGDVVQVQNQTGPHANKWDMSGVVVESLGFDSYVVKVDGSGRLTKRNRRFLRPIRAYKDAVPVLAVPRPRGPMDAPGSVTQVVPDDQAFSNLVPEANTGVEVEVRDDVPAPVEPSLRRSTRVTTRPERYGA